MKNYQSNYDKSPCSKVKGCSGEAWQGYSDITSALLRRLDTLDKQVKVITVECYPGVRENEIMSAFIEAIRPALVLCADDASMSGDEISRRIESNLTEDRVFGVLYHGEIENFFVDHILADFKAQIHALHDGILLIYGTGASIIHSGDLLVYADLARWEIQQRYRSGELANWKMDNYTEDTLRKYKRGFFVEWRMADRLKKKLFPHIDYFLDTNLADSPRMVTAHAFFAGMKQVVSGPFRVVPYFDPGVWGGQWMKKVFNLDDANENYAWSFDGVPEENSLYLQFDEVHTQWPAIDLVFLHPVQLLGNKVHARFGTEFPIRFDLLDTMGGQNLSLQVHPLTEYIQEKFGMHYTQDESYYILDAHEDATVFLGVKKGVTPDEMIPTLEAAQRGEISFPAEKFVNRFPAKKHDHFLIPAGTVHCSGNNCMILEISATPYIFTFKLWDWDRLGLDGLPRPVHVEHGAKNIQYDRDTQWVTSNLINQVEPLEEGDGWLCERTGLHEREFIETHRFWFTKPVSLNTCGSVNVLNLVEGDMANISSPDGLFETFEVHYAETVIIPENIGRYIISPSQADTNQQLGIIQAFVRV